MVIQDFSVKHVLLDCPAFNTCRKLFYEVNSLKELISMKILEFLSNVNICNITRVWLFAAFIVFVILVFF